MRSEGRKHYHLRAWQEAMQLVSQIYRATAEFPSHEMCALTSQMRRAAVSIPSNIAEGAARTGDKEFLQFLSIARGSLSELETQIIIARDLGYLKKAEDLLNMTDKMFSLPGGLINSLKKRGI